MLEMGLAYVNDLFASTELLAAGAMTLDSIYMLDV